MPCTWGVEGFIRINSNAGTLAEQMVPYKAMWILTGVYFLGAWWSLKWIRVKSMLKARA